MRIRSVKTEYWAHRMHAVLSKDATILGAAILNLADDEGRGEASVTKIQGQLLPHRLMDVEGALKELEGVRYLILYTVEVDGLPLRLFQVTAFARHQSISKWLPSVLPSAPGYVFVSDPRSEKWDEGRNGKWRRGKWVKVESGGGVNGDVRKGEITISGGLREDSGSVPASSMECSGVVAGGVLDGSSGKGMERIRSKDKEEEGKGVSEGSSPDGPHALAQTDLIGGGMTNDKVSYPDGANDKGNPNDKSSSPEGCLESWEKKNKSGGGGMELGPGAVIPTKEEVVEAGLKEMPVGTPAVDRSYAEWFHGKWSADRSWTDASGRRLKDWRFYLRMWWGKDRTSWMDGRHPWSPYGNGNGKMTNDKGANDKGMTKNGRPLWGRIKDLEEELAKHAGNPDSIAFPKTAEAKAEFKAKRKELAELKKQQV